MDGSGDDDSWVESTTEAAGGAVGPMVGTPFHRGRRVPGGRAQTPSSLSGVGLRVSGTAPHRGRRVPGGRAQTRSSHGGATGLAGRAIRSLIDGSGDDPSEVRSMTGAGTAGGTIGSLEGDECWLTAGVMIDSLEGDDCWNTTLARRRRSGRESSSSDGEGRQPITGGTSIGRLRGGSKAESGGLDGGGSAGSHSELDDQENDWSGEGELGSRIGGRKSGSSGGVGEGIKSDGGEVKAGDEDRGVWIRLG
jgi:hypothetical protein